MICTNPETSGEGIGVSQILIDVLDDYGPYGTCNICVNGQSPLNHSHACTGSEYVCDCEQGTSFPPSFGPCGDLVGIQNTSGFLGADGLGRLCPRSSGVEGITSCAVSNAADKLQGLWYSTFSSGEDVTWRLREVVKRVLGPDIYVW